ncbi:hypothetical protein [Thalassobacter stenotrophicus]|uniref:Uncharacterized protein n=2 Tax=Thalassobacter stenotrophicus TaxID=266809 RepID=A0A0P1EZP4_9RHOB|nr:hypothetical protein [Thalassobacter stenotrophicus]CUH60269.1 hypothetical protein THS5294_01558 [Thalassobacter stenotrophicus]SHI71576.1 hypothetical protein SAMN02744035_01349 [Thalassobacter stenotrophicus DSM 16310]
MFDNETAGIGHNKGPVFNAEIVEAFAKEAAEIADAASVWGEKNISTPAEAGKLKDFLDTARSSLKEIEARRQEEKKPFLDAGREIDAAFKKITGVIEAAGKIAKAPLQEYLDEQDRIAEEQRRAEQQAARKAAEEAENERRIAERNRNAAAIAEAEEKAAAAVEAAKASEAERKTRISSATGTGNNRTSLRTVLVGRLSNINQAMLHYRERQELHDLIVRMANADIRAAKGQPIKIPGIEIFEEKKL